MLHESEFKLLITTVLPQPVLELFRSRMRIVSGDVAQAQERRPHALLCSIDSRLGAHEIESLPETIGAIATYSVGHDHIDLEAAERRGIAVFNTPEVLSDAVADAAMLLILAAARRVTESVDLLRSGRWQGWAPDQLLGIELAGKTLGILGMGSIGRRAAIRARAFGMTIAYHNRKPVAAEDAVYVDCPLKLVSRSDVVLLAWPSTPETRHFVNADALGAAKPNLILVNIGRGDLVRDADVIDALRERRIFAAGLDVFDGEPDINPGYLALPNAVLLPHIGSSTIEARMAMGKILADALEAHANGSSPSNRIA